MGARFLGSGACLFGGGTVGGGGLSCWLSSVCVCSSLVLSLSVSVVGLLVLVVMVGLHMRWASVAVSRMLTAQSRFMRLSLL
eukprot:1781416-Pyramimonas_sp.AAC.1